MPRVINHKELHTIYAFRCAATKRVYIGNTIDFDGRVRAHYRQLENREKFTTASGTRKPSQWQLDYDEYGRESFQVYKIATELTEQEAMEEEQRLIERYDSMNPDKGYNLSRAMRKIFPTSFIEGLPPL